MRVTLTQQETVSASLVGLRRQLAAIAAARRRHPTLTDDHPFDDHIVGAMAELAVARTFNLFWDDHVGNIHGRDVGGILEVRCRRPEIGPDLGFRENDKNDRINVLVHAQPPVFTLVGWMTTAEGKQVGTWHESAELYFVKPGRLHSIEELFEVVEQARHRRRVMPELPPLHEFSMATTPNSDERRGLIDKPKE